MPVKIENLKSRVTLQEDVIIPLPKNEEKILTDSFKNTTNLQVVLSQVDEQDPLI